MDIFLGIVVGLVVLMILVIVHEFGHFIASRRNGVNVLEFGIGFPPRAVAWIKDPKTHKWRKLKRSEWKSTNMAKTVGMEKPVVKSGDKVKNASKNAKIAAKNAENEKALLSVKNREKIIQDGLVFSLNWLPIGGFCQMDGESAEDERKGTFGNASFWKKTKILFAGVAMNWLTAFIILTVLAWTGMPTFLDGQFTVEADTRVEKTPVKVASVREGSPAETAGFLAGDYILKVDDEEVWYGTEIIETNEKHAGEEVNYTVLRKGEERCNCDQNLTLTATLNSTEAEYLLGVVMESSESLAYSSWSAPIVGAGLTLQITGETFKGLGQLVWNLITGVGRQFSFDDSVRESGREAISTVGDSVTGPIGILGILFPSFVSTGPANVAFIAALISISLACMNVLPIPALDGGRWALIGIFKLRHKKLTKELEEKIVTRAFMVLIALIIIVTILDITRFFR